MTAVTDKSNVAATARASFFDRAFRFLAASGRLGTRLLGGVALFLVHGYRLLLSPVLPGTCRYGPSCSEYAAEAIVRHGPFRGGWLAFARVARCHPWGGDGYDPVPAAEARGDRGRDARRA